MESLFKMLSLSQVQLDYNFSWQENDTYETGHTEQYQPWTSEWSAEVIIRSKTKAVKGFRF